MPSIQEIFRTMKEHEDMEKAAAAKTAIQSPQRGSGDPAGEIGATLEDVMGPNVAEMKVRIKKKLDEVAGQAKAVEGLTAHPEESPTAIQQPQLGDKMPPGGDTSIPPAKAAADKAKAAEAAKTAAGGDKDKKKGMPASMKKYFGGKKADDEAAAAETEKGAEEKLAEEYYAAGQIMARGFSDEIGRLFGGEKE